MNSDFFKNLDAAFDDAPTSRREALAKAGRLGGAAALAVTPLYAMARDAMASKSSLSSAYGASLAHDPLNFALTLEYLEYFFYLRAVDEGDIPSSALPLFEEIRDNELAHVDLLRTTIEGLEDPPGDPNIFEQDDFDFTAAGFDPFADGNYEQFLVLAQGFEDTGVRAYKGQAGALQGTPYLTPALQIHSVEARHAAAVRRLRENQGWIPFDQPSAPGPITPVYGAGGPFPSEANTTQGGVELTGALMGYTEEEITEAFDEALDMETVLGIAGPFITGDPD
jgi:rubrerythrin